MAAPRFRIFFDMDGVLVNFDAFMRKHDLTGDEVKKLPGAYREMRPITDALDGIRKVMSIAGQYGGEVWLATKPPTGIPFAYGDKVSWVLDHLPELKRRIILTHDKGLLGGPDDYLIDDRPHRANCERFQGTLIHFGVNETDAMHPAASIGAGGWVALVPLLHDLMKAKHAPDICGNCDTALPRGCGGIFKDDGAACELNVSPRIAVVGAIGLAPLRDHVTQAVVDAVMGTGYEVVLPIVTRPAADIDPRFAAAHFQDGRDLIQQPHAGAGPLTSTWSAPTGDKACVETVHPHRICDACETVAHCTTNGCIPVQQAAGASS
jgi:5'(3')-deoxyribonucleotidase